MLFVIYLYNVYIYIYIYIYMYIYSVLGGNCPVYVCVCKYAYIVLCAYIHILCYRHVHKHEYIHAHMYINKNVRSFMGQSLLRLEDTTNSDIILGIDIPAEPGQQVRLTTSAKLLFPSMGAGGREGVGVVSQAYPLSGSVTGRLLLLDEEERIQRIKVHGKRKNKHGRKGAAGMSALSKDSRVDDTQHGNNNNNRHSIMAGMEALVGVPPFIARIGMRVAMAMGYEDESVGCGTVVRVCFLYVCVCMHACLYVYMAMTMGMRMRVWAAALLFGYGCTCVYACMPDCKHTHTYIHTHITDSNRAVWSSLGH
jgi:hypothetical protein